MWNSDTSLGVGSLSYVHFFLLELVGPDQPGIHHSPGLGCLTQSTLGLPVHAILALS